MRVHEKKEKKNLSLRETDGKAMMGMNIKLSTIKNYFKKHVRLEPQCDPKPQ